MSEVPLRQSNSIHLAGVRVHNLKGIDVELPLGKLIVVAGVSGSGKSSLAFDALHAEGQRRYLEAFPPHVRQRMPKIDKPDADSIDGVPPSIGVGQRIVVDDRSTVVAVTGLLDPLRPIFAGACETKCPTCSLAIEKVGAATLAARLVAQSSAAPIGLAFRLEPAARSDWESCLAALRGEGLVRLEVDGVTHRLDGDGILANPDAAAPVYVMVDRVQATPSNVGRLTESLELAFLRGNGVVWVQSDAGWHSWPNRLRCSQCGLEVPNPRPRHFHPERAAELELSAFRLLGLSLAEWLDHSIDETFERFRSHKQTIAAAGLKAPLRHLSDRLDFLRRVGLGYVTLGRRASTLSTGELRRAALSAAFGADLSQMLFVLDEPTAGHHPSDTQRLIAALRMLRDRGNTVVVVEHDPDVIAAADWVVELGPGAGIKGGEIVYAGAPAGRVEEPAIVRRTRKKGRGVLRIIGAAANNLQSIDVAFPLGCLCAVCGPSGAGKSSLVLECLVPAVRAALAGTETPATSPWGRIDNARSIDDVVVVEAAALGRSARGNAATYVKIFDEIRALFAETIDAKVGGLPAADFSFNLEGGRCEHCRGSGVIEVDMAFLDDVSMTCPACQGRRYRRRILEIKFRGLDIAQVLDLTVREAFGFFRNQPRIQDRLHWLIQVGLEYLRIGQPLNTLSGGEGQRLKLAAALGARSGKRTLFVFDEPTIGLHAKDVGSLLESFDGLLAIGHSIVVIEHDPALLMAADHLIALGPGAGPAGGRLTAQGTPQELSRWITA